MSTQLWALYFSKAQQNLACATDKTKPWKVTSTATKQHWNPCSGPTPVYQDLSTCHDWPVEKAIQIVDLTIRMKGNSKYTSRNLLSPFGAENKDLGAASLMILIGVWFCLRYKSKTQRKLNFRISIFPLKNFIFGLFFQKLCESLLILINRNLCLALFAPAHSLQSTDRSL